MNLRSLFCRFVCFVAILFFASCSKNLEDIQNDSKICKNSQNEFLISRSFSEFENDATFCKLQQINDSIVGSENRVSTYSIKNKLGLAILAAVDARGFIDGARYGWQHGNSFSSKLSNATLFGVIFSVAYSAAVVIEGIVENSFGNVKNSRNVASATASVYQQYNINYNVCQTINLFSIRVESQDMPLISNSFVHNPVLSILKNEGVVFHPDWSQTFSQDQISIINSEDFKEMYANIDNQLESDTELLNDTLYPRECQIFARYLKAIRSTQSKDFNECFKKIEGLCYEYCNVIKSDNKISEDHKNDLIMSLYVAPFSVIYWHQLYPSL